MSLVQGVKRLFGKSLPFFSSSTSSPSLQLLWRRSLSLSTQEKEKLESAKAKVNLLTADPGNAIKLQLYALYKQVSGLSIDSVRVCVIHYFRQWKVLVTLRDQVSWILWDVPNGMHGIHLVNWDR